jgi:hypothetical protein
MTKITLSIAAAAIAAGTLFTSAAQACISCEYVPEVVHAGTKKPARKEIYAAKPQPTPKKRIAKMPSPKKYEVAKAKAPAPKKIEVAKAPEAARPVETAKPVQTAQAEPAAPETTTPPAATPAEPREKPISTAALIDAGGASAQQDDTTATAEAAPTCKKFFPAVGMTLTVPCE